MNNFLVTVGVLLSATALTILVAAGVSAFVAIAVHFIATHVWDAYPFGYLITWGLTIASMAVLSVLRKAV